MIIPAGKTKIFDMNILNPYTGEVNYGIVYTLNTPSALPSGVTIARASTNETHTTGTVGSNTSVTTSVIVVNESSSNITLTFSVITGYKNGGDLIVHSGNVLIDKEYEVYTPTYLKIDNSGANAPAYAKNLT